LQVDASDSVFLSNQGSLVTESSGNGASGNLTINTRQLILDKNAKISNSTTSAQGGDITLQGLDTLQVSNSLISSSTASGTAGSININASDSVELRGSLANGQSGGLLAEATNGGTAGNLTLKAGQVSVRDGARATVSSPQGQAGNLTIQANSLVLNRGSLFAQTAKSDAPGGANITIQGLDLLRLDNESLISANAFNQATGGNITIDSTFIVATPPTGPKGSDITANARQGKGGAVNITTQGLYGIEFRPQLTPKNDITVSSDFGLNGTFQLTRPFVEPTQSLTNLPTEIGDASRQIVQNCRAVRGEGGEENKFIITGRGGLPPSPNQPLLHEEAIAPDWVTLDSQAENNTSPTAKTLNSSTPELLREANGWIINDLGQVELMATVPTVTPHSSWQPPVNCHPVSQ
jgi:large exoprotein involved in heme utilization and adhesion